MPLTNQEEGECVPKDKSRHWIGAMQVAREAEHPPLYTSPTVRGGYLDSQNNCLRETARRKNKVREEQEQERNSAKEREKNPYSETKKAVTEQEKSISRKE